MVGRPCSCDTVGRCSLVPQAWNCASPATGYALCSSSARNVSLNLVQTVLAVSPSGDQFVYAARDGLYLRRMDEVEARRISGTEGESTVAPFSPNGEWIGYGSVTSNQLKKVRTSGGKPEFLANVVNIQNNLFGPSWTADGWILWVEQPE